LAPLTGIAFANNWLINKLNLKSLSVKTTRMTTNSCRLLKAGLNTALHVLIVLQCFLQRKGCLNEYRKVGSMRDCFQIDLTVCFVPRLCENSVFALSEYYSRSGTQDIPDIDCIRSNLDIEAVRGF
jgi:hypothetical protein